jgi:hypothetical protein
MVAMFVMKLDYRTQANAITIVTMYTSLIHELSSSMYCPIRSAKVVLYKDSIRNMMNG